jgi:hypothetical protein
MASFSISVSAEIALNAAQNTTAIRSFFINYSGFTMLTFLHYVCLAGRIAQKKRWQMLKNEQINLTGIGEM